ncbi:MAG: hypothetical protein HZA19_06345 [Nitrospirae bacterium]|nr:hypothetical protein [Nitrospirota bacterium]
MRRFIIIVLSIGFLSLAGCAGRGEIIPLDLHAIKPLAETKTARTGGQNLSIDVAGFEDARPDKKRLGVRQHSGGGVSYFDVRGGKLAPAVTEVAADYLRMKGWNAKVGQGDGADVVLTGKLLDFSVQTESTLFVTDIKVKTQIIVEAKNTRDGSTVRMTLEGNGSQSVFGFNPEDVENLLSEVLAQNFEKLLSDTQVKNGILRLQ